MEQRLETLKLFHECFLYPSCCRNCFGKLESVDFICNYMYMICPNSSLMKGKKKKISLGVYKKLEQEGGPLSLKTYPNGV